MSPPDPYHPPPAATAATAPAVVALSLQPTFGLPLTPVIASAARAFSSLPVVANALRPKRWKRGRL